MCLMTADSAERMRSRTERFTRAGTRTGSNSGSNVFAVAARRVPAANRESPLATIERIFRDGKARLVHRDRRGQILYSEINPRLARLFSGSLGYVRAQAFLASAHADEGLREAIAAQGVDIEEWEDWLREATPTCDGGDWN